MYYVNDINEYWDLVLSETLTPTNLQDFNLDSIYILERDSSIWSYDYYIELNHSFHPNYPLTHIPNILPINWEKIVSAKFLYQDANIDSTLLVDFSKVLFVDSAFVDSNLSFMPSTTYDKVISAPRLFKNTNIVDDVVIDMPSCVNAEGMFEGTKIKKVLSLKLPKATNIRFIFPTTVEDIGEFEVCGYLTCKNACLIDNERDSDDSLPFGKEEDPMDYFANFDFSVIRQISIPQNKIKKIRNRRRRSDKDFRPLCKVSVSHKHKVLRLVNQRYLNGLLSLYVLKNQNIFEFDFSPILSKNRISVIKLLEYINYNSPKSDFASMLFQYSENILAYITFHELKYFILQLDKTTKEAILDYYLKMCEIDIDTFIFRVIFASNGWLGEVFYFLEHKKHQEPEFSVLTKFKKDFKLN